MKNPHLGSTLQGLLEEDGIAEEVNAAAIKQVLAWQIGQAMKVQALTKREMARRMRTSRTQLDRLLDPDNDKVSLETMHRAASAVGKRLVVGLRDIGKAAA